MVFSSFGLEKYLNPGIWILGTVAAFGLVFLFKEEISPSFPRVAFGVGVALFAAIGGPLIWLGTSDRSVAHFFEIHTKLATTYFALSTAIPIGVAVLSYRAREGFQRLPLPSAIDSAVEKTVFESDFVYEDVAYVLDLIPNFGAEGAIRDVLLRFEVRMTVVNRSRTATDYRGLFDPAGRDSSIRYASINNSAIDHDDPEHVSRRGLWVSYHAQPGEHFELCVSAESLFHSRDSELVGIYRPASKLSILVRPAPGLQLNLQSLLPMTVSSVRRASGELWWEYAGGILPYQGARLYWEPASSSIDRLGGLPPAVVTIQ